jgi:hypothetical protein
MPHTSCAPPGKHSTVRYPIASIFALSAKPRSVNIRIGPRVMGKNRIPRRCNSRSQSRKCSPERSWIVFRPLGQLRGASIGTRSGCAWFIERSISSSLNATCVCTPMPRRTHTPVGRRGDPARSMPTTTNAFRFDMMIPFQGPQPAREGIPLLPFSFFCLGYARS